MKPGIFAAAALGALISPAGAAELLVIESHTCPFCEAFDSLVLPTYHGKVKLRQIYVGDAVPPEFKGTPYEGTPTFILWDRGHEKGRFAGWSGVEGFYSSLDALLNARRPRRHSLD